MSHSNDINAKRIEKFFKSPIPDKVRKVIEKIRGGYVLVETRPPWDGSEVPWTRHPVAKIVHVKSTGVWKLYWMRASGKWNLYEELGSINEVIETIKADENGCFWG
jgi:hypothetical protein